MYEWLKLTFEYSERFIEGVFAEVSIFLLLLGSVLFLMGLVVLILSAYIRFIGHRVDGTVVGGIKDIGIKEEIRDGKTVNKTSTTYYAVFEYQRPQGTLHREKSSNGGNNVLKYKTGQAIKLIIVPGDEYDDVYDAEDKSSYILGSIFVIMGVVMLERATSIYASLSIGAISVLLILISLVIRGLLRTSKKKKAAAVKHQHYKLIKPGDIYPIEELAMK